LPPAIYEASFLSFSFITKPDKEIFVLEGIFLNSIQSTTGVVKLSLEKYKT